MSASVQPQAASPAKSSPEVNPTPQKRQHNMLRLESAPLHTESKAWAAHAPAQVKAACERGAHVIGFTEVTKAVAPEVKQIVEAHGYTFIHGDGDTALAVQSRFKVLHAEGFHHVAGLRGYSVVTFTFYRSQVTVFNQHWGTNHPSHHDTRVAQTKALIEAMGHASWGHGLAFYMGDANPNGHLSEPHTFPREDLDKAGFPLVYEALHFPQGIGVNVLGYAKKDGRVQPVKVATFDARGSDHIPTMASYRITRPLQRHAA